MRDNVTNPSSKFPTQNCSWSKRNAWTKNVAGTQGKAVQGLAHLGIHFMDPLGTKPDTITDTMLCLQTEA